MTTETYDLSNPDKPTILKDPQAVLDYPIDWTEWLNAIADTISTFTVTPVTNDIVVVSSSLDATHKIVTMFLSGGTLNKTRQVTCHITTVGGRQDDRSIFLKIRER